LIAEPIGTSELDLWFEPELGLTVERLDVDMKTLLFARKEEEAEGAIPKDRRAHADDDGKRGGARLVANAIVGREWAA
jgi:hypothetical protein